MYQQVIDQFIQQELLPAAYKAEIERWYAPLAHQLAAIVKDRQADQLKARLKVQQAAPLLVGINGAQGTGKSTLTKLLVALLHAMQLRAVHLSIDDFYLSKQQRAQLAAKTHALLATRGVPGTHDVDLLQQTLQQLAVATRTDRVVLPAFDKASDDIFSRELWREIAGPIDVIFLEGWFVGATQQTRESLLRPVNALEREEDSDGRWRRYVNERLECDYQSVFNMLNMLVMLQAPGFDQIRQWRSLQEEKLRLKATPGTEAGMTAVQLERFMQHFERLTRHCLLTLPASADIVFALDQQHQIVSRTDKSPN